MPSNLLEIVEVLNTSEVRLVRSYLKSELVFDVSMLELFDVIHTKKVADEEACKLLFGKPQSTDFNTLKSKLKDLILRLLTFNKADDLIMNEGDRMSYKAHQMFFQGKMLCGKGASKQGVLLLKKTEQLAKKYEIHEVRIMALNILRMELGFDKGIKQFKLYSDELEEETKIYMAYLNAKTKVDLLSLPHRYKANKQFEYKSEFKKMVDELEVSSTKHKSTWIKYWYYKSAFNYFNLIEDYSAAISIGKKYLKFIETEIIVKSKNNIGGVNMLIGYTHLALLNHSKAIEHFKISIRNFEKAPSNELIAMELLMISYISASKNKEGVELTKRGLKHKSIKTHNLHAAKWNFFQAAALFGLGKFSESQDSLLEAAEMMKDRSGWLLGVKLLEILNLIELKEYEQFDYRHAAFMRLLHYIKHENVQRTKAILKVLTSLDKNAYDFKRTIEKEAKIIEKLVEAEEKFSWNPQGFEIIRFDKWLYKKAKMEYPTLKEIADKP